MAEEDDASKTEEPTEKKLAEARRKGNVAQSQEIKNWGVLLAGTGALMFLAPFMANGVREIAFPFVEQPHAVPFDFEHLRKILADIMLDLLVVMAPFMLLMVIFAIASNIGQFGLLFSIHKVKPDASKLNVLKGIKRMVSVKSTVEFVKGIAKLVMVTVVSMALAIPLLGDVELLPQIEIIHTLDRLHLLAIALAAGTVGVMTAIAALDFMYQKHSFTKQMRMSKQEVKDEHKQQEGDPQVKSRIRRVRMERHNQRMMQAVPEADVVITNPTHFAIALQYTMGEMNAPRCIAKGVDHLAFRIRSIAEENDVPVVENPPLARALYDTVDIDEEIPPEHFTAVAEIIGFIMRQRGDLPLH